ncbi:hypothetical protein EG346_03085 [Chryseobacterium carnipullorum]|uniref:Uncharacterized protein n=1 Tax=Chryseobacterium carnipullorum TaxID=1124835 RepID=A0A1M7LX49_CHRCU|nr:hypothetical protein [Chryseobacterium carnipullorum]MDN5396767.1 hypothetical protein [Chryseobacterium sp.]AZA47226.1 hypothetical protein EG346_03085 [Chryseobacterium carnipullorum]AZA66573.1 hypothetical protein EG345_19190 [Chryseobacterium carnipullorum]MDN5477999.1 hypothetical protein [Chryseobacterium sp.]MDN5480287.1 hypothetical protein [Chryseobacterium sp.]
MKNIWLMTAAVSAVVVSCGTVQSLVQNTFPYTANVLVSTGVPADKEVSSTSTATNVQTWFGGNNNAKIKDVRISDAKISVVSPSGGNLSAVKSVKVYVSSSGTGEKLVASRSNITTDSSSLNLDLNDTGYLDEVVKSSGLTVRTVYELKNQTTSDMNLKIALNFNSVPAN